MPSVTLYTGDYVDNVERLVDAIKSEMSEMAEELAETLDAAKAAVGQRDELKDELAEAQGRIEDLEDALADAKADFGVPRVTISNIVRGKAWKRLPTIGTIAPAKPHVMTPEKLAIGLKLIARGLSITAAACEIAVSRRTLSRAVHKQKQKETP